MRMIVLIGLLLFAPLCSLGHAAPPIPAPAVEQNCIPPANLSPEVTVTSSRGVPQYSYNQNSGDLGQKAAGKTYQPNGVGGPKWHTGGLTQSNITIQPDIESHTLTSSDQRIACAYIDTVKLNVELAPVVWVANEFPAGTCMYDAVKFHEMKHVNADRIVLNQHLARIHTALAAVTEGRAFFGPGSPDTIKAAVTAFMGQVKDTIDREAQSFYSDEQKAQRAIDTMQEYQRISHLCPKQLQDIGN